MEKPLNIENEKSIKLDEKIIENEINIVEDKNEENTFQRIKDLQKLIKKKSEIKDYCM